MTPMTIADVLNRSRFATHPDGTRVLVDANNIRSSKRIHCSAIANTMWREAATFKSGSWFHFDHDMPARMPFDTVWIEWATDPDAHDEVLGKPEPDETRLTDVAVRFFATEFNEIPAFMQTMAPPGTVHGLGFDVFIKYGAGFAPVVAALRGLVFLDEDYRHLPNGTALFKDGRSHITDRNLGIITRDFLTPALYTLGLMNCKNVGIEAAAPQIHRSKKSKPDKIPRLEFHTIKLPGTSYTSHTSHTAAERAELAHHLVRGHFKTYTADAPLLGRAVGTYWWGWQARGSKKNGIVVSDYEVGRAS